MKRKSIFYILISLLMVVSLTGSVFAANETPINATFEATAIEFTIPEAVTATASASSINLTYTYPLYRWICYN